MRLAAVIAGQRWIWAGGAVVILWLILGAAAHRFGLQNLSGILTSASFLTIVALGQTVAISSGRGNIDLSVAGVMTLAGYVYVALSDGTTGGALSGLAGALLMGAVVGLINGILVTGLRMPAIVATLAVGYVLVTAAQVAQEHAGPIRTSPVFDGIVSGRTFGMPNVFMAVIGLVVLCEVALRRTGFGRALTAVGQNDRAAALVGTPVATVTACAFVISGVLAALAGAALSVRLGGAFLDMGPPYLIQSIGAVVVGGTAIMGGSTTFLGTMLGSVLLLLIVTTMQVLGLRIGMQEIVQGVVIMVILAAAGSLQVRGRRETIGKTESGVS